MGNYLDALRNFSYKKPPSTVISRPTDIQQWLNDTQGLSFPNPLRVLMILSQRPSETGSGVYLREVVSELQKLDHQIYVLAADYKPLTQTDFPPLPANHIFTTIFDNQANSKISEIKFPISGMSLDMPYLHKPFHSLSEEMLEEYCRVWIKKISDIVQTIKPHIIHINHLWLLPGITKMAVWHLPVVATYHGSEFNLIKKSPGFNTWIGPGIRHLNTIMPVSNDAAQEAQETFGVLPKQTRVVGNGYNPNLFRVMPRSSSLIVLRKLLKQSLLQAQWRKVVLYVGKFADYKGLPYLIQAAKIYSSEDSVLTVIVGDGSQPVRKKLSDLIEQLELTNQVVMPGKVAYNVVSSLMNAADVFVLPSVKEGFGLVLLEALACGIRGVAAATGGPPSFVPPILLERKMVSLIDPLKLLTDQLQNGNDEDRYVHDLAKAIKFQLSSTTSNEDRYFIAQSVQNQTWNSRARDISYIYFDAIQSHRSTMVSNT